MKYRKLPPAMLIATAYVLFLLLAAGIGDSLRAADFVLKVRQIAADNSGSGVDKNLDDIKHDLKKINFNSFSLKKTDNVDLGENETVKLEVLGDNTLEFVAEGVVDGKLKLNVKIGPKNSKSKAMNTTLRIPDGATFLIGGPAYGEGSLILAFTASF